LEALSKIQTAVTDIAARQEDIFRRLNDSERPKASETLQEDTAPIDNSDRDVQLATHATKTCTWLGIFGMDEQWQGHEAQGRRFGAQFWETSKRRRGADVPFSMMMCRSLGGGRGPTSTAEIAHAFRMARLFDENQKLQRLEDEQRRDDGPREYPDSGHDLDPFSRSTVFAPNEPRIHEFRLASIS
jgi:hypothetical protein